MMQDQPLESQLEGLLKYGTAICSVVIAIGILLDVLETNLISVDLVTVGIAGFIALPMMRILAMLSHYAKSRDFPMVRAVAIVLTLMIVGLILGVVW